MIVVAYVVLSVAAVLFVARLLIGPSVPDRILALDALLITVMCVNFMGDGLRDALDPRQELK